MPSATDSPASSAPSSANAAWMVPVVLILAATYGMMAYLSTVFDIRAMSAHEEGYRSVLSQVVEAIIGRNWLYWIFISALLILMALSANTAFADSPP